MASSSAAAGRRSPEYVRPDMRDLRIVLLGKNVSENNRVGNIILGTTAFHSEPSSSSQQHSVRVSGVVEKRNITVINTPHLLQPHLSPHQITQRVTECVSQSAPGPHVIALVLQYNDFSEQDRHRVKTVLNLFSEKAIKHTIVLTTDEERHTSKLVSMIINNSITNLIKECGGRHLQFDERNPGWRSEMIRMTEEMLKKEFEEFLICDMFEEEVTTSGKTKLNIVLCGYNTTLKTSVSKMFRGKPSKPQKETEKESKVRVKREEKIHGRQITVIELPALTRLSEEEVMRETRNCVSLCDPGVHLFIFVTPVSSLTKEDKAEMEKITRIFYSKEHFMVLFTSELTVDQSVSDFVASAECQRFVNLCGSWYHIMGLKDQRNTSQISKILDCIESMNPEPYSLQMYMRAPEKRVRHELEEKLSARDKEIKELQEKIKTLAPEGVKLNLVVCGSDRRLKSFISNLILNQRDRRSELSSECVRRDVKVCEYLISLVELPALINSELSEEEVMRQTLHCVSLCDPGVHVFIIIIPDAPINNEDRAEIEKIQKIFSSRINKHIMILIYQNSEHQTAELNEETQSVIESFGGRHHFIGPNTQVSMLMERLKKMVEENSGVCFSTETLLEAQMEKLQKFEEMKMRIHSLETWFQTQDSRERADDLRIVLLGKTGVGKSATGNTILGREEFISDTSQKSITKVCQKKTVEINGRHVTVIDTPGLFDTELTNEEIQREITNCISMVLPGPHVFLLLIPVGRFTQEEAKAVKIIQDTFGENSLLYTIVLFTRGDDLKKKTIEQWLGDPEPALKILIEACGNRFHVFNNNQTGDRTQVSDLLKKIDDMVKANGDSYYSGRMFREMEREIQEQQKKILTERVEQLNREKDELMNKHEEEKKRMTMTMEKEIRNQRKRREEEFREREERYKRDIKDIEDHKRKIQQELKRLKQALERRNGEREILQSKHEEERERMKLMMEEERQNHDKERKRREEEFREREERYKSDIKDIEDHEKKMREEMKQEREEWERQKQEERQKEEETHNTDMYSQDDEDSGCLRILLFGRTGNGKSATGNTILGIDAFRSEDNKNLVTTSCKEKIVDVDGKAVSVVDTPGLFDMTLSKEKVVEEIMNCVSLSAPGPHVFVIVLSLGRITQEKQDTLEIIKKIFGPKAAEFSIVLFTRADDLTEQTIEQLVEKSKNDELNKLVRDCGNRFLAFNNGETQDRTQVTQLLNMIEELKKSNEGRYFTSEMFESAISIEKRREMLEENKRKNQAHVEELEARYDTEIKSMRKRLEEKKQKTDEERVRLENKFREKEETLKKEFEKKEKSELKKLEEEDQKRSEEEEQRRAEHDKRIHKMEREIENQRLQYEKLQKEREEEDRKREEEYKQDQENMKNEQEHIIAELSKQQEEEMIEEEREKQKREREEKEKERNEMKRRYEQLERERKEEWERRKQENEERRREKRKRWEKMMEDLKQDQEEEIERREREEREIIEREEKECKKIKQKHEEEIKEMKKKHQDEARKQEEELNDFSKRKEQYTQEFKKRLEQLYEEKKKQEKRCHVM